MSGTGESAAGAEARADATVADAAVANAQTAAVAAEAAIAASAIAAANAEANAAEQVSRIADRTETAIAEQENDIAFLRSHAAQVQEWQTTQSSALTTIAERQERTETALAAMAAMLAGMAERLTPPASQTPPAQGTENPAEIRTEASPQNADGNPAQDRNQRRKHNWI
jgi:hypothetical protein